MNEADVRAEVIDPLLRRLGYQSGTDFNIERERTLRYPKRSLGRKKATDPEIRGRPDYILEIRGIDRWIVEAKPPNEDISIDDIEQGFSYAFLPEVAAAYFVLCNGRSFKVYRTSAGPAALPLIDLSYDQIDARFQVLENLLGPASFRRAALAEHIDIARPLAEGRPSTLAIIAGEIEYADARSPFPPVLQKLKRMIGVRLSIESGFVWRMDGQIAVRAMQGFLHKQHEATSKAMGVKEVLYLSSDTDLSVDAERPSIFESMNKYQFCRGQPQFDIFTQEQSIAQYDGQMTTYTEAVGHLNGDLFSGSFFGGANVDLDIPGAPSITLEILGTFRLKLGPP